MTRVEFMKQLKQLLRDLPEHDRLDAIAYYEDYFDEAGPEKEAEIIRELESPQKVADTLKRETANRGSSHGVYTEQGYSEGNEHVNKNTPAEKTDEKKKSGDIPLLLIIILIILSAPIWGGLLSGALGVLIGVLAAVFGCMAALLALSMAGIIGGAVVLGLGVTRLVTSPPLGLLGIGVGALMLAAGLLLMILFLWLLIKVFPMIFRFVADLCRKGWRKLKGGN